VIDLPAFSTRLRRDIDVRVACPQSIAVTCFFFDSIGGDQISSL